MVAKTLVAELDDGFAFALVPGDRDLSLRGLARAADSRSAALAAGRDAQRLSGYQIGDISPFGSRTALPVFALGGWLARDRVALNGGARGVILELASADLRRLLSPAVIAE
jgi:Cys-tRNA(Pro)/Cys-tRNA(Cys) deacylase